MSIILRSLLRCILLAAVFFVPALSLHAQDKVRMIPADGDGMKYWPRWRGQTGQGIAADGPYPDTWSDTENVLWKVPVPGKGNSSPIIWGKQLFLTSAYDNGKRRSILCFDRTDGAKLWEAFVPEGKPEGAYGKNGWASGTPTTDGERVYAYFGNQGLFCVDMQGKQQWHVTFGNASPLHGMACSPLLYKDRVILFQEGGNPTGFIIALDKKTGKQIWKTPRKETVSWGSPVAIRVNNKDQIIVSSSMNVYAYDADDGKVVWTCGGNLLEVIPTPVVGHDLLFCCSGRAGPTLAINPLDAAGDITRSQVAWKAIKGSPFIPSPLLYGDYLYMVNDMVSVITCYEAKTGKLAWQERCGEPVSEGFTSSPIGVNNKVFFTNDKGETFVMAHGPEYKLLGVNRMKARVLATPALLDGRWYWRTDSHLICIGKKE
jgi:outer membrane protein assembly factor BamB